MNFAVSDVTGKRYAQPTFWQRFRSTVVVIALLFTVTLAVWWVWFGLHELAEIETLRAGQAATYPGIDRLGRQQRMLLSEGGVLIFLLIAGGVSLIVAHEREAAKNRDVQRFLAVFSHDLKTALTSVRLQSDALLQEITSPTRSDGRSEKILIRLQTDFSRIETQLENALYLSESEGKEFSRHRIEKIELQEFFEFIAPLWPRLKLTYENISGTVIFDRRALENVFRNIFQNAMKHGHASALKVSILPALGNDSELLWLEVSDNGIGMARPDAEFVQKSELGAHRVRLSNTSGSGLGLQIIQSLFLELHGEFKLRFENFEAKSERLQVIYRLGFPRGES